MHVQILIGMDYPSSLNKSVEKNKCHETACVSK